MSYWGEMNVKRISEREVLCRYKSRGGKEHNKRMLAQKDNMGVINRKVLENGRKWQKVVKYGDRNNKKRGKRRKLVTR